LIQQIDYYIDKLFFDIKIDHYLLISL